METRELRYFVAVAEELHFGRAAERLGIAQPPLSRMISQFEQRLGYALLERTSRKVRLTEAGSVLLAEGRAILGALAAAERHARQAAANQPALVLATKSGVSSEALAKLLEAYAAEPDAVAVDLLLCDARPQQAVHDGRADVVLLHQPYDSTAGLDTETLSTESQVAVLPSTHPLAGHARLRTADVSSLPDLPMARWPGPDGAYPDGPGAEVHNLTQLFQLIALGRTTVILVESCRPHLPEGLTAVPVLDAPPVTTQIGWPPHSRSRPLADLIRVATRLLQPLPEKR